MVEAARKHRRVVQVGTQRRSSPAVLEAAAYVRSGKLGRVALARAWHFYKRPSIGHVADEAVPAGVDYDLWLGPAPKRPFNRNRFHYNWHWNWDYGTGELGNNGVHGLDMVRILLGLGSPGRVSSTGGIFVHRDDRTTPDTQTVTFEYPNVTVVWEHLQGSAYGLEGPIGEAVNKAGTAHLSFGAVLYGTEGTLVSHVAGWEVHHGTQVTRHAGTNGQTEHVGNFLDCMRSRAKPNADIETGYGSATLCHLGNIAYRVGRTVKLDPVRRRFAGDAEADALLGRTYRAPFVLPEKV
jgi:predicted dehydrogenase